MQTLLIGAVAIFFSLKALGGTFPLPPPLLGALIASLVFATVISYLRARSVVSGKSASNIPRGKKIVFLSLFLAITGTGIFVRAEKISEGPPDIRMADMIPMVLAGLEAVRDGKSPYFPRVLQDGRPQEGYYLPGIWMIYLPLYLVGVDVRYMNLLPPLIFYLLLLNLFLSRKTYWRNFEVSGGIFLGLIALHAFSKILVKQVIVGHTALFALTYILFLWGARERKTTFLHIVLPLLLISREIAVFTVIPYLVWIFLNDRKEFWTSIIWIVPIGLFINLPFVIASGSEFFAQTRVYMRDSHTASVATMLSYYGLTGFLKNWGLLSFQPLGQILGAIATSYYLFRHRGIALEKALALGGISYLSFILFAAVTWGYLFIEPIVLCYFLIEFAQQPPATRKSISLT